MIIAHLPYDIPSLRACSLTCYSWYIAAAPGLHHTLTIRTTRKADLKFWWPNPLLRMHRLHLLPMVEKLQVHEGRFTDHRGFSTDRFNCCILYRFCALTNVRELELELLDLPRFMPRIRRYFRQFLPTVRSLTLTEPKGCRRQIICFIGLFQHLEDLHLLFVGPLRFGRIPLLPEVNLALIPVFAPPLRGRLKVTHFGRADFWGI